jgi:hypothetical protein
LAHAKAQEKPTATATAPRRPAPPRLVSPPPAPAAAGQYAAHQLVDAQRWLAAGRPDEARQILAMAQTQMVLRPVTPDHPLAEGGNPSATDIGAAIRWLDIGAEGQACRRSTVRSTAPILPRHGGASKPQSYFRVHRTDRRPACRSYVDGLRSPPLDRRLAEYRIRWMGRCDREVTVPFDSFHQAPGGDLQILTEARDLISDRTRWLKHSFNRDGDRFCLVGALSVVCGSRGFALPNRTERRLARVLAEQLKFQSPWWASIALIPARNRLMWWNDRLRTTHDEVLALFDRTISALAVTVTDRAFV